MVAPVAVPEPEPEPEEVLEGEVPPLLLLLLLPPDEDPDYRSVSEDAQLQKSRMSSSPS